MTVHPSLAVIAARARALRTALFMPVVLVLIAAGCGETLIGTDVEHHFFLESEGALMPVSVEGNTASRTFIVALHGGPGSTAKKYFGYAQDRLKKPLESRYAMVYWDQRHAGNAQGTAGASTVTIAQNVEDLDQVITLLKHRYGIGIRIVLLGHSWGGYLEMAYLTSPRRTHPIAAFIDVDGPHDLSLIDTARIASYIERGEEEIAAGHNVEGWREIVDYCRGLDVAHLTREQVEHVQGFEGRGVEMLIADGRVNPKAGTFGESIDDLFFSENSIFSFYLNSQKIHNTGIYDELERSPLSDSALARIDIPALFIFGAYDFRVPPSVGRAAYEHLGTAPERKRFRLFGKSEHVTMLDEPEEFVQAVVEFVGE